MRKRLDPMYLLVSLILRPFHKAKLAEYERAFVLDNTTKHASVMWINALGIGLVTFGLQFASQETIGQVISTLIAPVMVMGAAWFAISFGGVPKHLVNIAMAVTFWMFTAFLVSLSTMFVAVFFVVNPIMWPVFAIIYVGALISCILYDTADGLKAGLDEAVLKHSRAALVYYKGQGIPTDEE